MSHIPNVREALLELIALQKQRIAQLEVQNRHQSTELCKLQDTSGYYSLFAMEHGDIIRIRGEDWRLDSRDRNNLKVTLQLITPK